MGMREDLLEPIPGENPSGPNLYYDKVLDQIKEARIEDDDSIPTGDWGRPVRKADRPLVIKLAGEMLAKRTKDLRLAGWYVESLVRREGFSQLPTCLQFLHSLQETFWDTLHPEREEDGDLAMRAGMVESAVSMLAVQIKLLPLTRTGINYLQYQDSRALGFDADATTPEKQAIRQDAISRGRLVGEDLRKAVDATPKSFYVELKGELDLSLEKIEKADSFHLERYGEDAAPDLARLKSAIEDLSKVVNSVLTEKRRTEPDPEPEQDSPEADTGVAEADTNASIDDQAPEVTELQRAAGTQRRKFLRTPLTGVDAAYAQVADAAEYLRTQKPSSAVPYLLCAALRMGEARDADLDDMNFGPAPSTEERQMLRRLANDGKWEELLQHGLTTLVKPCGKAWLDLHRYLWRAATESSYFTISSAIVSTVRALLLDRPMLREATLDDDTPAANAETQQWIVAEVLSPASTRQPDAEGSTPEATPVPVLYTPPSSSPESVTSLADVYDTAVALVKKGRAAEAISLIARDSEQQPSGRMRFQRRVQMARLCLAADHASVAYPVLVDLSAEIERRALESWESAEMLAQPLSLLLRCLEQREGANEDREAVFARLCRLDPQAALSMRR